MNKYPFTLEENKIMDMLIDAHNLFVGLEKTHSREILEWSSRYIG